MRSIKIQNECVPSDGQEDCQSHSNNQSVPHKKIKHKYSNKQSQKQLGDFFTMFQQFINNNKIQAQTARLANNYDLEVRDREVLVQLPPIINKKITKTQLKTWIAKVMRTVSSAAFHYFQNNEMTFEQTKVYCSENILKNIVILGQSVALTDKDFEAMDEHIKKKVLNYLSAKYPMTDSAIVNKKLQETVCQVNHIESPQNNYFDNTDLVFQYREDGNYNDLIMRMMNEIMGLVDQKSGAEKTNYEDFQQFMGNIFEKVENEDWVRNQYKEQIGKQPQKVNQKQNIPDQQMMEIKEERDDLKRLRNKNEEKERYRAQVKEYTNYMIGRKLHEDTPEYSEKQIASKNIDIKAPAVLRILTKLCEALLYKLQSESYYSDRSENITPQGGQIGNLPLFYSKKLDECLVEEREQIQKHMKELSENNYQMQENLLKYELRYMNQGDEQIDEQQKISAKFSLKVVNNLHSQIIYLLNRLIHGLMKVAKRYYDGELQSRYNWPSPPNILTFMVGDLIRSKCSSHQKQILLIYKEIQRLSRDKPQKLRIVRIKNRLRSGTNDILINVKFNDKVICEIQLAVKATTSNFIKCSNQFHHYLYELQRSYFGPLTELCSIWSCLDPRKQIYQQLIDAQDQSIEQNEHICVKFNQPYEMVKYQRSFICGQCSRTYFHNNYICSNSRCSKCGLHVCYKCQLSQKSENQLIHSLIDDQQLRNLCVKRITETDPLPELGACVFMESQSSKAEIFTHFFSLKSKRHYILSKDDDKIIQIAVIETKKQEKYFRDKYTIYKIKPISTFSITKKQIQMTYLLPNVIKENYHNEKETLSLMQEQMNTSECSWIMNSGTQQQKKKVKNLLLNDNLLAELPYNIHHFTGLYLLSISGNTLDNCKTLQRCNNLSNFLARRCNFQYVPVQIFSLKNLLVLDLSMNSIQRLSVQISNLTRLINLKMAQNNLFYLPEELCECFNLRIIDVGKNSLQKLPDNLYKLQNLEKLICNDNYLTTLPEKMGELKSLGMINISGNIKLKHWPSSLENLSNLKHLDYQLTSIPTLYENIKQLTNLTTLQLSCSQSFTNIPPLISLRILSFRDFQNDQKLQLPLGINKLVHLKQLHLQRCNLMNIQSSLSTLNLLQILNISQTKLTRIDVKLFYNLQELLELTIQQSGLQKFPNLSKCRKLTKINFNGNQILQIPNNYIKGLVNIEQFRINSNKITYFPNSILDFTNLRILQAESNPLQDILNEKSLNEQKLSRLSLPVWPKLSFINLHNTQFKDVPKIVMQCPKLEHLAISTNKITSIPTEIGNLVNLRIFSMQNNRITRIPVEMSKMKKLQNIYLAYNKITLIPSQLQQIRHLKILNLDNNPIQCFQNLQWIIDKQIQFATLKARIISII